MSALQYGRASAAVVGGAARYAAAAILVALGVAMLLERDDETAERLRRTRGAAFLLVGLAISLDELALGFTIGLLRLSLTLALVLIAAQAILACQLGLAIGARLGANVAEGAERFAGGLLIALGIVFLAVEI